MPMPLRPLVTLFAAATLALPLVSQSAPLLSPAEAATLREKFRRFLREDAALRLAADKDAKDLVRTERARTRAEEDLLVEWQRLSRKGDLLASPADLRQVFHNAFPLPTTPPTLGAWRDGEVAFSGFGEVHRFALWVPKAYRADTAARAVVLVPGSPRAGGSVPAPADYQQACWGTSSLATDTIWHGLVVPANWQLDQAPDRSADGGDEVDAMRARLLFGTLGDTVGKVAVDRARVFLDCGRGACGFGLRFGAMFPDRFAGLVLREPVAADGLRLGSLANLPILMVRTPKNAAVVDALQQRLATVAPRMVTVLAATDEYPHPGLTGAISDWVVQQQRSLEPKRVVVEPVTDDHNRAYWVDIEDAELLASTPEARLPRLDAEADRASNTVRVSCRGVERFTLQLNDDLLDLGKPFTIVVNGREYREQRTRSFQQLRDGLVARGDWDVLFPVALTTSVPK
jgi:hypothetical protein